MKISKVRLSQRSRHPVGPVVYIIIDTATDDQRYDVSGWSLSGFKIDTWIDYGLNPAHELGCGFSLAFQFNHGL